MKKTKRYHQEMDREKPTKKDIKRRVKRKQEKHMRNALHSRNVNLVLQYEDKDAYL